MAEPTKKKTTATSSSRKTGGGSGKRTATDTAYAKSPASRSEGKRVTASTASKKSPSKKKKKDPKAERRSHKDSERAKKKGTFSQQFLPYILGGISLFLLVCLIVNLIAGDVTNPVDHPMGLFGYWLCQIIFGILGWAGYLVPAVLILLTIFWRRYHASGKVVGKVILSTLFILLVSGVIHVFSCHFNAGMRHVYDPITLFETGADFHSGGVLGGLLGFALYWALRLPGTIVLAIVAIPLILMCLVGVTPVDVFGRILQASRNRGKDRRGSDRCDRRNDRRAKKSVDEDEDEIYDDDEEYDDDDEDDGYDEYDEDDEADEDNEDDRYAARRTSYRADRRGSDRREDRRDRRERADRRDPNRRREDEDADQRLLRLDPKTGEVIDPDGRTSEPDKGKEKRGRRRRSEDLSTEDVPAEDGGAALPLWDHQDSPSDEPLTEGPEDDVPWEDGSEAPRPITTPSPRTAPVATATVAESNPYVGRRVTQPDEPEDDLDSMEVGFDDEIDDETVVSRRAGQVNYEVVNDAGEATGTGRSGEPVTVRILKSETGAVDESGLSEEEIVLPSGSAEEEETPPEPAREYQFPSIEMLTRGPSHYAANEQEIAENTQILRDVLESFRIGVREISCSCGPTITRFEVKPDTGVRVRSIANLVDDIAMGLAKAGVRIEAPIPGKSAVGIEVPNAEPSNVYLRNILETPEFRNHKSRIAACLGADVSGRPVILDINKMPHLLIAGATGTGKSVCINSLVMSILYKAKPDEVKLILIDPKKVEFAMYRDLPHLYAPVVSDPKKAAGALNSAVNEMERRFELIEEVGVRNLAGYNELTAGDPERPPLPQMVIIIDELADLMMTAPAEVETAICRLAQKARAAGIHLIIGTQRPSVDVITGLIKANVPSRIAFTVKSGVDSRTILDTVGADKLIGRGDMLYAPIGSSKPIRAQGCFVTETEVERVVTFIKEHNDPPVYNEEFARSIDLEAAKCGKKKGEQMSLDDFDGIGGGQKDNEDPKFWEALEIVVTKDKIGTSALQRGCNLGYGRAAKIIDRMEELGFVGPDPGTKQGRKVNITKQELIQYKLNGLPQTGSSAGDDGEDDNF